LRMSCGANKSTNFGSDNHKLQIVTTGMQTLNFFMQYRFRATGQSEPRSSHLGRGANIIQLTLGAIRLARRATAATVKDQAVAEIGPK